ncbi:MAG: TSUP family transporter [Acidobacteriota bacterium]|nr:TSUP family transporter [Acidobacteriota bacterium]
MDPKTLLLAGLIIIGLFYFTFWFTTLMRQRADRKDKSPLTPSPLQIAIGFVTNFFDTLGIGSYATTTAMYRAWNVVRDEKIPGTLNVGHTLPTIIQAIIFITIVEVEFVTLISIIGAAVVGAWLGAGVVSGLPRRKIQIGMGIALLAAAMLMLRSIPEMAPYLGRLAPPTEPGVALGVSGALLGVAIVISAILGALMMLGIGYYAPCLILISMIGMNPKAAFPIMMGACAFLMPTGSLQFIRKEKYDVRAAIGLLIGGPVAVLIAAPLVEKLPINYVRWGVVVVVIYTAIGILRTASKERAMKGGSLNEQRG